MQLFGDRPTAAGAATTPGHSDIAILAFKFWLDRGAPFGTPDVDWLRAEEELKRLAGRGEGRLAVVAKEIGSALGTLAALATNALPNVVKDAF